MNQSSNPLEEKAPEILSGVVLKGLTSVRLGGKADYFCNVESVAQARYALRFAADKGLRFLILGGGSNIVFPNEGFRGIVVRNCIKGIQSKNDGEFVIAEVDSGENWDSFVEWSVTNGCAGVECLSGIPGTAGAAPVQNVGAYGQEVRESVTLVEAIDTETLEKVVFSNKECVFSYRNSRFKSGDPGRYFITKVSFRLRRDRPELPAYKDLHEQVLRTNAYPLKLNSCDMLMLIRNSVINVRKRKGMVLDQSDPDTVSCGSFFTNPVISREEFSSLSAKLSAEGLILPGYESEGMMKVPAAWLIENAGFHRGYRYKGAGVSSKHTLALVNYDGDSDDLIGLSAIISGKVLEKFGITLHEEPQLVRN